MNANKIKGLLLRTNPLQRVALGAAIVAIVTGLILLVTSGTAPTSYAPLYTGLAEADASSVVNAIAEQGVAYELKDGGATIMVPREKVYDLRLQLAGQGLPKQNDGYALLDQQGITTSEFRQRTAYQRALEGEIENTIEAVDGVDKAVVHLALPDATAFVDSPGNPTASVLVRTSGVRDLSRAQVDGIVYLVSSAVRDMTPEDVTVTNGAGVILHAPGVDGGVGVDAAGSQQTDFESRLEAKITEQLSKSTGAGKVSVKVTAQLNMDKVKQVSEKYTKPQGSDVDANTGLVGTDAETDETYNGVTPNNNTVLGPDGAPTTGGNQNATVDYVKGDGTHQYLYDKMVEEVQAAPGAVEKLSVAVVVDDKAISADQVTELEKVVRGAAGIDDARGDQIVVTRLPFAQTDTGALSEADKLEAEQQKNDDRMALIRTALIVFALLVMLGLGYRSVRRARQVVVESIDVSNLNAGGGGESETTAVNVLQFDDDDDDEEDEEAVEYDVIREENEQQLQRLVDMQPEAVAQVLRTWLND